MTDQDKIKELTSLNALYSKQHQEDGQLIAQQKEFIDRLQGAVKEHHGACYSRSAYVAQPDLRLYEQALGPYWARTLGPIVPMEMPEGAQPHLRPELDLFARQMELVLRDDLAALDLASAEPTELMARLLRAVSDLAAVLFGFIGRPPVSLGIGTYQAAIKKAAVTANLGMFIAHALTRRARGAHAGLTTPFLMGEKGAATPLPPMEYGGGQGG